MIVDATILQALSIRSTLSKNFRPKLPFELDFWNTRKALLRLGRVRLENHELIKLRSWGCGCRCCVRQSDEKVPFHAHLDNNIKLNEETREHLVFHDMFYCGFPRIPNAGQARRPRHSAQPHTRLHRDRPSIIPEQH